MEGGVKFARNDRKNGARAAEIGPCSSLSFLHLTVKTRMLYLNYVVGVTFFPFFTKPGLLSEAGLRVRIHVVPSVLQEPRMPVDISPENEQFIQQQIKAGVFRTRTDAIDSGVELLRRRTELLDRIDWGRRQLDQGDYHEYDDESLQQRFEQLKHRAQGGMRVQEER